MVDATRAVPPDTRQRTQQILACDKRNKVVTNEAMKHTFQPDEDSQIGVRTTAAFGHAHALGRLRSDFWSQAGSR